MEPPGASHLPDGARRAADRGMWGRQARSAQFPRFSSPLRTSPDIYRRTAGAWSDSEKAQPGFIPHLPPMWSPPESGPQKVPRPRVRIACSVCSRTMSLSISPGSRDCVCRSSKHTLCHASLDLPQTGAAVPSSTPPPCHHVPSPRPWRTVPARPMQEGRV